MNIEQWLGQYGYWAVFCGVMIEGPITLTLAGFLAHQGYLSIFGVIATAFAGAFLVIEVFYLVGMLIGRYLLARWPAWAKYHARFSTALDRHRKLFLLGFRFFYGGHTLGPMAIGMARVRPGYFSMMNAIGAAIWTSIYFAIGYFFGHAFELIVEDMKRHEKTIALVLVAAMLVYYLVRRWLYHRNAPAAQP